MNCIKKKNLKKISLVKINKFYKNQRINEMHCVEMTRKEMTCDQKSNEKFSVKST